MPRSPDVVAVIDDDSSMLDAMKRLLWAGGYETELYDSAAAFLNAAANSKAACLLVDIQLGESNGIELIQLLAQLGFEFPVIFMSGSDDQTARERAINAGAVAFLRKPFSGKSLIEALSKAKR